MNDLNTLLDRAAGPVTAPVDPYADLTRARRARSRTRRRRRALGLAGVVAAAGVVGVGVDRLGSRDAGQHTPVAGDPSTSTTPPQPLPTEVTAGPYTFPGVPEGWEIQDARPQVVTIARVGDPDQEPLSFPGKLVLAYDQNPPSGEKVQRDGRTFWVAGGGDTAVISTRTRPGEPDGEVTVQYPTSAFTTDDMITFLAGVRVGPGAQPGLG